jgi:hypothetical protein
VLFAIFLISCSILLNQLDCARTVARSQLSTYSPAPILKYTKCAQIPPVLSYTTNPCKDANTNKVCAISHDHLCTKPPCYVTVDGGCNACEINATNEYINHGYVEGDCKTIGMLPAPEIPSGAIYCGNRFDVTAAGSNFATCPDTVNGVCAHLYSGESVTTGSWDNACLACNKLNKEGTRKINYYIKNHGNCSKQRANLRTECKKSSTPPPASKRKIIEDGDIISIHSRHANGFLEMVTGTKGWLKDQALKNRVLVNPVETENSYWEIRHADRDFKNKHFKTGDVVTLEHVLSDESIFAEPIKSIGHSGKDLTTGAVATKFKFIFAKNGNENLFVDDAFTLETPDKTHVTISSTNLDNGLRLAYHFKHFPTNQVKLLLNISAIHLDYTKPAKKRNIVEDGDILSLYSAHTNGFLEMVPSTKGWLKDKALKDRVLVNTVQSENSYWEIRHADRSFKNKHFKTGDEVTFRHVLSKESIFAEPIKSIGHAGKDLTTGAAATNFKFIFATKNGNGNLMVGENFNLETPHKSLVTISSTNLEIGLGLAYHFKHFANDHEKVLLNISALHIEYKNKNSQ